MKILRKDGVQKPVRLKGAIFLGLLFCVMGLYLIKAYGMWPLGLVYVAGGTAGFLHLRSGGLLMICASCLGGVVFWINQAHLYRSSREQFFSVLNRTDLVISTCLFALVIYYFMHKRVKEVFLNQ